MSKLLEGLNPSQQKAVLTLTGPVQINAVAGSGKTRVLTHRIAYMLEQGIKPNNILCTTFTKKATEEMTARLGKLIPKMALQQITIGTSHSIGFRILAKEYEQMGHHLAPAFKYGAKMLMNGELKRFAEDVKKSIMADRTVAFEVKEVLRDTPIAMLIKVVSRAKNDYKDVQDFIAENGRRNGPAPEMYIEFYQRYEQMKWSERRIDADDLLFLLVKLFQERKDILAKYQKIYKYLLVDEAQDNNGLQYMLIKMLAYPENNIFIVGDDDQAMYSFRGAKPEEFIHFKDNYRGVSQIALEDNYRSNPGILDAANKLIAHNTERIVKQLRGNKKCDDKAVFYQRYENEDEEASSTVAEIKTLLDQEGYHPKEISILYRTNAQSRSFEDQLIIAGIPYVIHGGISFYERKEVKDIVAYLRLAVDYSDDSAFQRVINVPTRYLGKAFMDKVNAFNGSNWDAITSGNIMFKDYERRGIEDFTHVIYSLKDLIMEHRSPTALVDYILYDAKYEKYLKDDGDEEDEGNSRLENIATLKHVLDQFETLADFLNYIKIMTSSAKHSIDGVQLMTIHKAKGLEFPATFVVGASEGLLPHFKAVQTAEETGKLHPIEEERRLMYVAVTRAEKRAYVSSTSSFNGKPTRSSRFVLDMGLVAEPKQEQIAGE